jgi:RimJ/RimL family protein N-acetyltransferase
MTVYRPMPLYLDTDRLILRPWALSNAEDYAALTAERDEGAITVDTARERIAGHVATTKQTGIALLTLTRHAEGDFIGYCGLVIGRATLDEPEIAYELFRRVHGHGCATEAARVVLDAAISTGRSRLWSTLRAWNTASLRVLEKLGFHRDRVAPDEDGKGDVVWTTRALP